MTNETTIDLLIKGCRKKDSRSQRQLYNRFYGFAMGICQRYATDRHEATENMNKGFLKAFLHLDNYESEERFKAWLGRIMINASIDTLRTRAKRTAFFNIEDCEIGHRANTEIEIDYKEMLAVTQRLPKCLRRVFHLYAIEGYTHKEIGQLLGKSDGTCKFHLSQAREMLKKLITNQ